MPELHADLLIASECVLGECIRWNERDERVYWTDLEESYLWSCDADGGSVITHRLPERLCSFSFCRDGSQMLAGFASGLYILELTTIERSLLFEFEPTQPSTRLNDGRCDEHGRFVVGGLEQRGLSPTSSVIRFDGAASTVLLSGVGCANSIAFSPDGRTMYFADSPRRTIIAYDYNSNTKEALSPGRVFATLGAERGFPDGSCVDSAGGLWNAQWGGGRVQRYLPDGALDLYVTLPASQVTSCCFGGSALDRLFVTTARRDLSAEQLQVQPLAGAVFVARPGVRGLAESRFGRASAATEA